MFRWFITAALLLLTTSVFAGVYVGHGPIDPEAVERGEADPGDAAFILPVPRVGEESLPELGEHQNLDELPWLGRDDAEGFGRLDLPSGDEFMDEPESDEGEDADAEDEEDEEEEEEDDDDDTDEVQADLERIYEHEVGPVGPIVSETYELTAEALEAEAAMGCITTPGRAGGTALWLLGLLPLSLLRVRRR